MELCFCWCHPDGECDARAVEKFRDKEKEVCKPSSFWFGIHVMFWNSIILCRCLFSYSFTGYCKNGCEKYFTLIWNQLFYSWKGSKEPANSSYFNICPEMIWPRNMELIVGSSYDFYVIYVILSNHYEIAPKAHLSHSWEPLRFFTWRQQQIWCLKALRNEEICQRLSTCGNCSSCWLMSSWWQLRYFLFSSLFGEDSQFD